jgi:hypothetical protein
MKWAFLGILLFMAFQAGVASIVADRAGQVIVAPMATISAALSGH